MNGTVNYLIGTRGLGLGYRDLDSDSGLMESDLDSDLNSKDLDSDRVDSTPALVNSIVAV